MENLKTFAEQVERGQHFGSAHLVALHQRLSALASWDAVIEFALAAQALTTAWAEALHRIPWTKSFSKFVSSQDTRVRSAAEMRQVPVGAFVAFVTVDEPDAYFTFIGKRLGRRHLVHAMVSLGGGLAAGVDNRRGIGIGHDARWEVLDLATLCTWRGGCVPGVALGIGKARPLHVRFRPLEAFQGAAAQASTRVAIENLTLDLAKRVSIDPEDGAVAHASPDWSLAAAPGTADVRLFQNTLGIGGAWRLTAGGFGWSRRVYFLPYYPRHIVKLTLGNQCPVFVNAALTGCSIFAGGDPAAPTIYHAGVIGSIDAAAFKPGTQDLVDGLDALFAGAAHANARAALVSAGRSNRPAFWKLLLERLEPQLDRTHWSEVDKTMYGPSSQRAKAAATAVVAAHRADPAVIFTKGADGSVGQPWAAYLGFLENGAWSLYLQENLTFAYWRRGTKETYTASFPIALTQVYPPGRQGANLVASVPDRIAEPFTPSDTVARTA